MISEVLVTLWWIVFFGTQVFLWKLVWTRTKNIIPLQPDQSQNQSSTWLHWHWLSICSGIVSNNVLQNNMQWSESFKYVKLFKFQFIHCWCLLCSVAKWLYCKWGRSVSTFEHPGGMPWPCGVGLVENGQRAPSEYKGALQDCQVVTFGCLIRLHQVDVNHQ